MCSRRPWPQSIFLMRWKLAFSYLDHPTIAPIYKTTRQRPLPYYWFDVGNYMVFYVVIDDVMEVRRFVYGARDLTRMLP